MSAQVIMQAQTKVIIDKALIAYVHAYNLSTEVKRLDRLGSHGYYVVYAERHADWWIIEARRLRRLLLDLDGS